MSVPTRVRPDAPASRPPRSRGATSGWFRAFWRWHFYAAFLVVPILLVLSVTGLIYLFRFQIEPLLHADLMRVEAPAGAAFTQPYNAQQIAVENARPGAEIVSMTEPADPGSSTRFSVVTAAGEARDVFVDPWTAQVLGSLDPDRTVSGIAVLLHGELMAGRFGDHLIELAACWAVVMAVTGYYLFVKGRVARRRRRRSGAPGARLRQRHGMVGAVVGVGLLGLLVTGLPWTGIWGSGSSSSPPPAAPRCGARTRVPSPTRPHGSTSRCRTATTRRCPGGSGPPRCPTGTARRPGTELRGSGRWRTSTPPSRSRPTRACATR